MSCAQTEITNVSGSPLVSSLFGTNLAVGETITVNGDVFSWLAARNPGIKGRRAITSLIGQIDTGVLEITSLPTAPCPVP